MDIQDELLDDIEKNLHKGKDQMKKVNEKVRLCVFLSSTTIYNSNH